MRLKQLKISNSDIEQLNILSDCLENSPNGKSFFRYFNKRSYDYLKNHYFSFLYFFENECIGYSHLDEDEGKIWLGIIVFDDYVGKGFGQEILSRTLSEFGDEIYLSVDKENKVAFNLYKKFGFSIFFEDDKIYKMKLIK